jgi:hypothetical protein
MPNRRLTSLAVRRLVPLACALAAALALPAVASAHETWVFHG